MQTKIEIKTPKGYASKVAGKLRPFLLGFNKPKSIETNKDDNKIVWIIESNVRRIMKINRNVALYESLVTNILKNKKLRKKARLNLEQEKELNDLLLKHTTVSIIKS